MEKTLEILNNYINIFLETKKIGELKKTFYFQNIDAQYDELTIKDFLVLYKIERMYDTPQDYIKQPQQRYKDQAKKESLKIMYLSYIRMNKRLGEELAKQKFNSKPYHKMTIAKIEEARNVIEKELTDNNIIPLNIELQDAINIFSENSNQKKKIK